MIDADDLPLEVAGALTDLEARYQDFERNDKETMDILYLSKNKFPRWMLL